MPVTYEIDPTKRLVISKLWGAVREEEVHEHNSRLRNDPKFDPSYKQLVDLTGITQVLVGTGMINDTARDQFFNPGTPRAFAASSDATFGLARMFALRAEGGGQTIEVFRELARAEEWLGLTAEPSH